MGELAANLPKEMQSHHYPILYQVEESHWWYVGRRRIIQSLVERICRTLNTANPRILDVGCGTGANLKMLAAYGRTEGVDISEQAVDFCRERGLDSVKLGAIEELPYESGSFDLVTALDVVEHLDDDVAGLREVRRVLRPDGRVLLFVPAFMFLWGDRKSTRLNSSHLVISYAVFCLKKKTTAAICAHPEYTSGC